MKRIVLFVLCLLFLPLPVSAAEWEPVRIALIDSGISSRVIGAAQIGGGKNYALPDRDTEDTIGHGTAVAGLILEVAPDAVLVPLVCSCKTPGGDIARGNLETTAQMLRDAVDIYDCRTEE